MTYIPSINKVQLAPETTYGDGTAAIIIASNLDACVN